MSGSQRTRIALLLILLLVMLSVSTTVEQSETVRADTSSSLRDDPTVPPLKPEDNGTPPTPVPTYELPYMTPVPTNVGPLTRAPQSTTPQVVPTPAPSDPIHLQIIPLRVPNAKDLTQGATAVALVTAEQVMPARWNTPGGRRPANPWLPDNPYTIFRPMLVRIDQVLKGQEQLALGDQLGAKLLVALPGGSVGADFVGIEPDFLTFEEGEQAIIFLTRWQAPGEEQQRGDFPVWVFTEAYQVQDAYADDGYHGRVPLRQTIDQIIEADRQDLPATSNEKIYLPLVNN